MNVILVEKVILGIENIYEEMDLWEEERQINFTIMIKEICKDFHRSVNIIKGLNKLMEVIFY